MEDSIYLSIVRTKVFPDGGVVRIYRADDFGIQRLQVACVRKTLHRTGLRQGGDVRRRTGLRLNLNLHLKVRASRIHDVVTGLLVKDLHDFLEAGLFLSAERTLDADRLILGLCLS